MKQKDLVTELYKACLEHNDEKMKKLCIKEFEKIIKHKEKGKKFTPKWTVTRI